MITLYKDGIGTLTTIKRRLFPARYRRKDARTAIYRAVYGPLSGDSRDGASCNYHTAAAIYDSYREIANLPFWKAEAIIERIKVLKREPRP